jgi:hypothetical protein
MRFAGRAALVAAAGSLLAGSAGAQFRRVHLTLADHLSEGQQEETIAVYLGGVLVGTLHVDAAHPDDSFGTDVPAMEKLPFSLCGKLLKREPDGAMSSHPIDNGGTLTNFADGTWAAITLGDVVFTLQDETGKGTSTFSATPACSAAVS